MILFRGLAYLVFFSIKDTFKITEFMGSYDPAFGISSVPPSAVFDFSGP